MYLLPRPKFVICRGEKQKAELPGKNFTGIFQDFTLKANKSLRLKGLSFFGPHKTVEEEISKYMVDVEVKVSSVGGQQPGTCSQLYCEFGMNRAARKCEKFHVFFDKPVLIPEYTWVDIHFKLDGPMTECLKEARKYDLVHLDSNNDVRVDCLIGSKQLSDLHFEVTTSDSDLSDLEDENAYGVMGPMTTEPSIWAWGGWCNIL